MKCPKYSTSRKILFEKIIVKYPCFLSLTEESKFVWLMANADDLVIQSLASFIYTSFTLHKVD